jgi:hypothetical protein
MRADIRADIGNDSAWPDQLPEAIGFLDAVLAIGLQAWADEHVVSRIDHQAVPRMCHPDIRRKMLQ